LRQALKLLCDLPLVLFHDRQIGRKLHPDSSEHGVVMTTNITSVLERVPCNRQKERDNRNDPTTE
jgi:hypothetical protein